MRSLYVHQQQMRYKLQALLFQKWGAVSPEIQHTITTSVKYFRKNENFDGIRVAIVHRTQDETEEAILDIDQAVEYYNGISLVLDLNLPTYSIFILKR